MSFRTSFVVLWPILVFEPQLWTPLVYIVWVWPNVLREMGTLWLFPSLCLFLVLLVPSPACSLDVFVLVTSFGLCLSLNLIVQIVWPLCLACKLTVTSHVSVPLFQRPPGCLTRPCLSVPLSFTSNPRMTRITRTCWCVRVPWEWPPVSLPL